MQVFCLLTSRRVTSVLLSYLYLYFGSVGVISIPLLYEDINKRLTNGMLLVIQIFNKIMHAKILMNRILRFLFTNTFKQVE